MYAQLGNIVFEGLIGWDTFSRSRGKDFAEHALIENKPRLQDVGDKLVLINFEIKFNSLFCDPENEIRGLEFFRSNAEVLPFINGNGENFGNFVIVDLNESWRQTDVLGNLIEVVVSVSLTEFVAPDKLGQKGKDAKNKAFAKSSNGPAQKKYVPRKQGEASSLMKSNNDIRTNTKNAGDSIKKAKQDATKAQSMLRRAQTSLKKAREALNETNRKLTEAKHAYQSALRFKQALVQTAQYISNAIDACASGDIDGALEANKQLVFGVDRSNGACSEIAGLTGSKRA